MTIKPVLIPLPEASTPAHRLKVVQSQILTLLVAGADAKQSEGGEAQTVEAASMYAFGFLQGLSAASAYNINPEASEEGNAIFLEDQVKDLEILVAVASATNEEQLKLALQQESSSDGYEVLWPLGQYWKGMEDPSSTEG